MQEIDVFARVIKDYGSPQHAQKVSEEIAAAFRDRLPQEFIDFWLAYGWGEYKDGQFRLCDPRPFDSLLELIFKGDVEFHAEDLTVIGYTAFCTLRIWNRIGRQMLIFFEESKVMGGPVKSNPDTGKQYSNAFLSGLLIYDEVSIEVLDLYKEACAKLGRPGPGEVFGYAPALQLGGEWGVDHLHRFKAIEHMTFLAQLGPLTATEMSGPLPDAPLGRIRKVRRIGPQ